MRQAGDPQERSVLTFVLGGARSGKSRFAQGLGEAMPGPRAYVATARPGDSEMAGRIARHRKERGERWNTIEEPLALDQCLENLALLHAVVVVDCLTLWLNNLLEHGCAEEHVLAVVEKLLRVVQNGQSSVILVSNEVGLGIVPATPWGRSFRDLQGRLNQRVAEAANRVFLMAAGIPLGLKWTT
jgi:adenosylcobinamide kinase/adenosylcobinamide-phosphate guanylyltransferase